MEVIAPYMNYIIIALVVIAAIILLSILARSFKGRVRGRRGKRLGVSEFRELDQSRRLMLIRRDNVEHLILVGGGQSLVIEQGIFDEEEAEEEYASPPVTRSQPEIHVQEEESFRPKPVPQPVPEPNFRPAPRAPSFDDRAPNVRPVQRNEPNLRSPQDDY